MVLNDKELISLIKKFTPLPSRIKLIKSYTVLGRFHKRYIPKELYLEKTGGAVSALLIEKGNGCGKCKLEEVEEKETHNYFFIGRVLSEAIKFMVRSNYKGPAWW